MPGSPQAETASSPQRTSTFAAAASAASLGVAEATVVATVAVAAAAAAAAAAACTLPNRHRRLCGGGRTRLGLEGQYTGRADRRRRT